MTRSLSSRRCTGLVVALVMVLAACTSDSEAPVATETSAAASPTASPTPELPPVEGRRVTSVRLASANDDLGFGRDPKPDTAMIDDTLDQVGDWLDAHLDALQRTGGGNFAEIAATGLASGEDRAPVTTHLASPDRPVEDARYEMTAYHAGAPQMVSVQVTVTHPGSEPTRSEMGFVVADDGTPIMMMFAPVPVGGA